MTSPRRWTEAEAAELLNATLYGPAARRHERVRDVFAGRDTATVRAALAAADRAAAGQGVPLVNGGVLERVFG
ncbi:hypothetical protein [Parafrankia sp. BMG5.11]|uniref:hypothetical protein n=1 Tax=Parafrankia sp. BMG5.11 TaxID=222540 RepID=UPI00103E778D|nr:hypothetical protein [Parafrankia sp. BMG5.11]TCJ36865.1 hypothetical protein E0504_21550 [Parafrankia sp. BMG5.11]